MIHKGIAFYMERLHFNEYLEHLDFLFGGMNVR